MQYRSQLGEQAAIGQRALNLAQMALRFHFGTFQYAKRSENGGNPLNGSGHRA
jgi:hypothetical protein